MRAAIQGPFHPLLSGEVMLCISDKDEALEMMLLGQGAFIIFPVPYSSPWVRTRRDSHIKVTEVSENSHLSGE